MFNCTVLGSIYIGTRENLSAVSALGLGLGTALEVYKRQARKRPPE